MKQLKVYFVIDPNTKECNGEVHPFCSKNCREKSKNAIMENAKHNGFFIKSGNVDAGSFCSGTRCTFCTKNLN